MSFDAKVRGNERAGLFVPRMSPFLVRAWMDKNLNVVPENLVKVLTELINLDGVTFWKTFEKFHALYECMRHVLLSSEHTKTSIALKDLYPGALISGDHVEGDSILHHEIPLLSRTLHTMKGDLDLTPAKCAEHLEHVVLAGPGNPGFDIAVPIKQGEWLLIEARFSQPDSSKRVGIKTDAIEKRGLIVKNVGELMLPGAKSAMSCNKKSNCVVF